MFALDQFIGLTLGEGARDDFEDPWEATESHIVTYLEGLASLQSDLDHLFATVATSDARLRTFRTAREAFRTGEEFDVWLQAVRRRLQQAHAGIHLEPLVDPNL